MESLANRASAWLGARILQMNNEPYGDASYSDKEGSDSGEKKSAKSRSKDARSGAQRYISNACKNCRALHRRCNGQPNCSNCKKRGIICEYGEPTKRGPKSRKGHADGDENYRDQNSKRSGKHKRGVTSSVQHGGAVPLYTSKNPFAESKQDVHGGAELSIIEQFSSEADARPVAVSNNEHGTFNAPFSSSAHDMMDKQLLEAAWSDLLQTWGTPVPSIALNLPHPLAYATAALHMMTHNVQLASSTLHLLSAGEHLSQQLPYYQPELLAAHAYRGVLIAFGLLTQNQRVQANQTMAATQQLINYLTSAQHGYNLDATTLLALAQFFSALYYINGGQSEVAARFAVAAFSTCQSYQDSRTRIPVSVWQRIYALRAALEDTDQQAWEGYSQLIIKDKTDPGKARPYDLLAHIVLVFLMTSNLFKNGVGFNLPSDVTVLHARMAELRELEVYLNKLVQSSTYAKQVSLGHFFLQSTLALLYLQYAKLHEMSLDDGLRQVHDCLSEARAHLTRVAGIKCCPALSLAIWLDTQLVRKLLELGKEVPNTVEAWSLLQSFNAPVVEERDKYPDNYCMPLNKLFATLISGTNREQHNSAKNSTAYQSQNYYNNNSNTFYHSPSSSSSTPSNVTNNFQAPPRSIAGYTADQSYRSAPFAFNEQYSKSVMSQYQQYARPNYPTTSPNHSPNTPRQQQQYASNQYAAPTTLNSNSASSFTSDPRSHSH